MILAKVLDECVKNICTTSAEEYTKLMAMHGQILDDSLIYQKTLVSGISIMINPGEIPLVARVQSLVAIAMTYGLVGGVAIGQQMKLEEFLQWKPTSNETIS